MKLRKELTIYKYSNDFIQIYPDLATIQRLRDILDLKEPIYERQESTFNGLSETRNLTFTNVIGFIVFVEVNGIIQLPDNYTAGTNVITYTGNLNAGDILSAVIVSSEELNVAGTENTWLGLFDTPDDYTGHAKSLVQVNEAATAIAFSTYTTDDIQSLKNTQHSHLNISALDKVDDTGDGSKYLASDGTYKTVDVSGIPSTTDDLPEGTNNLYYTDTRVDQVISGKTTDDLTEGSTNKFYSSSLFDTDLASKTTDDLVEGTTNLYYTDTRVSNNSDVSANTTSRHDHTNKTILDGITDVGSGKIITDTERTKLNGIEEGAQVNVNADWDATSGDARILNKPTIPPAINSTDDLAEGTTNLYYTDTRVTNVISGTSIGSLSDVNMTGATNNSFLQYDGTNWNPVVVTPSSGDMEKSVYDPNSKEADAFDYNNFINVPDLDDVAYTNVDNNFSASQTITGNLVCSASGADPVLKVMNSDNGKGGRIRCNSGTGGVRIENVDGTFIAEFNPAGFRLEGSTQFVDDISTDTTLNDNTNSKIVTQYAIKTYVDTTTPAISTEDTLTGRMQFAVVDTMPGTPDDNTIYFVK